MCDLQKEHVILNKQLLILHNFVQIYFSFVLTACSRKLVRTFKYTSTTKKLPISDTVVEIQAIVSNGTAGNFLGLLLLLLQQDC